MYVSQVQHLADSDEPMMLEGVCRFDAQAQDHGMLFVF